MKTGPIVALAILATSTVGCDDSGWRAYNDLCDKVGEFFVGMDDVTLDMLERRLPREARRAFSDFTFF